MTAKKIMFWLWIMLAILSAIGGATSLQFLPVVGILAILATEIWMGKNLQVLAVVFCITMAIINLSILAYFDLIAWVITAIVFSLVKYDTKKTYLRSTRVR